jgi:acyl-homoserine-lactone acylase
MSTRKLRLILACTTLSILAFVGYAYAAAPSSSEFKRWVDQDRNVSITRDDWGIAHVVGKTDADAVFGAIYAQAEDDFDRIEMNYINSMGRAAEVEGESAIWRDLRMKIFIDPEEIRIMLPARLGFRNL